MESAAGQHRRGDGGTCRLRRRALESARLTAGVRSGRGAGARTTRRAARWRSIQDGIRPLARRNLDTVRETYQLGRATVFDVLAEQRRYLETERAYTEALSEAYASRVSLSRATGDIR